MSKNQIPNYKQYLIKQIQMLKHIPHQKLLVRVLNFKNWNFEFIWNLDFVI